MRKYGGLPRKRHGRRYLTLRTVARMLRAVLLTVHVAGLPVVRGVPDRPGAGPGGAHGVNTCASRKVRPGWLYPPRNLQTHDGSNWWSNSPPLGHEVAVRFERLRDGAAHGRVGALGSRQPTTSADQVNLTLHPSRRRRSQKCLDFSADSSRLLSNGSHRRPLSAMAGQPGWPHLTFPAPTRRIPPAHSPSHPPPHRRRRRREGVGSC